MKSLGVRRSRSVMRRWVTVLVVAGAVVEGLDAYRLAATIVGG